MANKNNIKKELNEIISLFRKGELNKGLKLGFEVKNQAQKNNDVFTEITVSRFISRLYLELGEADKAENYGVISYKAAKKYANQDVLSLCLINLISIYATAQKNDTAKLYLKKLALLVDENSVDYTDMLLLKGSISKNEENYDDALMALFKAKDRCEGSLLNTEEEERTKFLYSSLCRINLNIGLVFIKLNRYNDALKYFLEAESFFKHIPNYTDLQLSIIEKTGTVYLKIEKDEEGIAYLTKCLAIAESKGMDINLLNCLGVITDYYVEHQRHSEVYAYAKKGLSIAKKVKESTVEVNFMYNLAQYYLHTKNYVKAIELLDTCKTKSNSKVQLTKIWKALSQAYELKNDLPEALNCYKKFIELQEAKHKEDKTVAIKKIEAKYDLKSKEKEIEHQKQINKTLEQFTRIASHDMREPLRTIRSFSDLLLMKVENPEQEVIDFISHIRDASSRMQLLLENLLNYAKAGNNTEPLSIIPLNEILTKVTFDLQLLISEKNATIKFNDLPNIYAHEMPLQQLFMNLISNSIKYSKKNVPAIVNVTCTNNDEFYQICIEDNGVGMNKDEQKVAFETFRRFSNDVKGTGLGLSICKKIVEQYEGKIWIESEENIGTKFFIQFPATA